MCQAQLLYFLVPLLSCQLQPAPCFQDIFPNLQFPYLFVPGNFQVPCLMLLFDFLLSDHNMFLQALLWLLIIQIQVEHVVHEQMQSCPQLTLQFDAQVRKYFFAVRLRSSGSHERPCRNLMPLFSFQLTRYKHLFLFLCLS